MLVRSVGRDILRVIGRAVNHFGAIVRHRRAYKLAILDFSGQQYGQTITSERRQSATLERRAEYRR